MSRTGRQDRTLRARIVYYGPAGAGKTANLGALHGAGARHGHELLSINTRQDSTLLFDLLPIELEPVLGRRVVLRLYTVPGHVRYDATRKVLLAGADAIVFVADSREARRDQNVWSLQNLRMNMRGAGLDPERVPIVFQMNRRDAPDAARPVEVGEWLGVGEDRPIPAVAPRGEGVLPALREAAVVALAGRALEVGPDELGQALDLALAPFADRLQHGPKRPGADDPPRTPIVLGHDDVLRGAIEVSMELGEGCSTASSRARRLAREADGLRALSQTLGTLGAAGDAARVVSAAIEVAREAVGAEVVSLVRIASQGPPSVEACLGRPTEPLAGSSWGERLLQRLATAGSGPVVIDLDTERGPEKTTPDLRWLAGVPLGRRGHLLLAYGSRRSGTFDRHDLRLLGSMERYLATASEKPRGAEPRPAGPLAAPDPARDRDRRVAQVPRRAEDRMRERLLRLLSGEMQAPLSSLAKTGAALAGSGTTAERTRLGQEIAASVDLMRRQLEDLTRVLDAEGEAALALVDAQPRRLVQEAIRLAGCAHVQSEVQRFPGTARCDLPGLARAVASLIDSAARSSSASSPVRVRLSRGRIATRSGDVAAFTISVFDRGPGAAPNPGSQPVAVAGAPTESAAAGIGLYEAQCLARRHGGTLERQPRKGGGSEFRLTVPLKPTADEASMEVRRG